MADDVHHRLGQSVASAGLGSLRADRGERSIFRVRQRLRLLVLPFLQQACDRQVVRGVCGGKGADDARPAVFEAADVLAGVVDDIECVGEFPHLVVAAGVRVVPLDSGHVLGVFQPAHGLRLDRRDSKPVGIVDHDADVDGVGDHGEVLDILVLVGGVVVWELDLQAVRAHILSDLGVFDGAHSVLRFETAHDVDTGSAGVDDGTHEVRPFVVGQIWALPPRGAELYHRLAAAESLADPPLGQVGGCG